jgi:peptidoglycan/xylan/chitin deacetylase (PgdA/CDA1 family)
MRTTVIAYHAVADSPPADDPHQLVVTTEAFAAQMDELARSRLVVPLDDVVKGRVPRGRPAVAITFDDGYRGVWDCAAPILADHRFPATVFVPTAHIGGQNRWDDLADAAFAILDRDELLKLEDGGVSIESHGHEHIPYDTTPVDKVAADVRQSTEALEDLLGRRPRHLAYPWGPSSAASRKVVADAGYDASFSIALRHDGRFAWARVPIQPTDSMRLFRLKTSGRYQALRHNPAASAASAVTRPVRRRLQAARRASGG